MVRFEFCEDRKGDKEYALGKSGFVCRLWHLC